MAATTRQTVDHRDTEGEWVPAKRTHDVEESRDEDGELKQVSLRSHYQEWFVPEDRDLRDDGAARNKAAANVVYRIDSGTATLVSIENRHSDDDDLSANVLRTIPAAENAVAQVSGVEEVVKLELL